MSAQRRKIYLHERIKKRQRLKSYEIRGEHAAHIPAFLDRGPRHDLHRAYQSAFMRGFLREQKRMAEDIKKLARGEIPPEMLAFGDVNIDDEKSLTSLQKRMQSSERPR